MQHDDVVQGGPCTRVSREISRTFEIGMFRAELAQLRLNILDSQTNKLGIKT
jgi:hypothetical protein